MPTPDRDVARTPRGRTRGRLTHIAFLLAAAVLTFGVLRGVGWLFGDPGWRSSALTAAVTVLICAPLSAWIGTVVTRRVAGHLATTDRLECSFRIVEGQQAGLTRRWRAGVATLSPGQVSFSRMTLGMRFLKGRPTTFEVDVAHAGPPRKLRGLEVLLVTFEARAVRLESPSAVLEWAITPAERIPWALERVRTAERGRGAGPT